MKSKQRRLLRETLRKAEEAINAIIKNDYFTTSDPVDVAALLGATRRLIDYVEKEDKP